MQVFLCFNLKIFIIEHKSQRQKRPYQVNDRAFSGLFRFGNPSQLTNFYIDLGVF